MIPRYNSYKDSGIEWIGEIPEHWGANKLKFIADIKTSNVDKHIFENETKIYLCNYTDVYKNDFIQTSIEFQSGSCKTEEFNKFQILQNDVIMTKDSETPSDIGVPAYVKDKIDNLVCGYHLSLIRTNQNVVFSAYLFRYLQTKFASSYFEIHSNGITRFSLGKSVIQSLMVPSPSTKEQTKIVEYLDKKTSLIDKLISLKERKIELLKEKRTTLINHVVTKGLNPNVKMKDSGIEWIGKIPEHWGYKKITHCFNLIGSGTTPSSTTSEYYENGKINWLQTGDLTDSFITRTSKLITQKAFDDLNLKIYPSNSLIIAMYGATIGKIGLLKIDTTTNQACCVLADPKGVYVNYVFYWFIANKDRVVSLGYGGGQPNISQETIKSLRIHCPPTEEQTQIVKYLDKKTKKIDNQLTLEQKKIDLLKEYRQSLISEVVTGKIKVTNDESLTQQAEQEV